MQTLDHLLESVSSGLARAPEDRPRVQQLMDELTRELRAIRRTSSRGEWCSTIERAREHRLRELVHHDPFTAWAYRKPRGYPGDAQLLDFIYGEPEIADALASASPLGQSIFARNRNVPSCRAVRHRKQLLTDKIRATAGATADGRVPRILSVACGHLREMRPLCDMGVTVSVTALDRDRRALDEVDTSLRGCGVTAVEGSVGQIVANKFRPADFDFVYAAGLLDYVKENLAKRLASVLFDKVAAGGRMLLANFALDMEDVGYAECYMNWFLILRDESDMLEIVAGIPRERIATLRCFRDPDRHIVFVEIVKGD